MKIILRLLEISDQKTISFYEEECNSFRLKPWEAWGLNRMDIFFLLFILFLAKIAFLSKLSKCVDPKTGKKASAWHITEADSISSSPSSSLGMFGSKVSKLNCLLLIYTGTKKCEAYWKYKRLQKLCTYVKSFLSAISRILELIINFHEFEV